MSLREFTITKAPSTGNLRDLTALDAMVMARWGSLVITSPNQDWVPKPFLDEEELRMRADGRFGYIDMYQWPQLFSHKYPWSVAVPSQKYHNGPSTMSWAWYSPQYSDFVLQPDSTRGRFNATTQSGLKGLLGIIKSEIKGFRRCHINQEASKRVEGVHTTLQKIWDVLALSNLTWRELVVQVADYQRVFLELHAIMDYHSMVEPQVLMLRGYSDPFPSAQPRWMGGFTWSPLLAAQLYAASVPVWLLRQESEIPESIVIQDIVKVWEPSNIVVHHFMDPIGQFAWPFEVLWRGHTGSEEYHSMIRQHTYVGKEHGKEVVSSVTGAHRNSRQGKEGWQPYPKSKPIVPAMDRDLWEVKKSIFLPPSIPSVCVAMTQIKKLVSRGSVKWQGTGATVLRFPDPAMIACVQSPDMMRRYIGNWLAIRPAWIRHVTMDPTTACQTSKTWRSFLTSTPVDLQSDKTTASAQVRTKALESLSQFLPDGATGATWAGDDSVRFRKDVVKLFKSIPPNQVRDITWELHELHFQFDVLAMDQRLLPQQWISGPEARQAAWREIFPPVTVGGSWDELLPAENAGVFRTLDGEAMYHYLNAFARLLSAWPGAPKYFTDMITVKLGQETVQGAMRDMLCFYVKTFYEHNGRPPICPRFLH